MSYKIGQVVFAVLSKKNHIYPMQIVEVITKKTMKGEEINYLLQGGPSKNSTLMLSEVDGEIFDTAETVRRELTTRATSQVNKLINVAIQKSNEWYGESTSTASLEDFPNFESKSQDFTEETVMLEDGTLAKIKLPSAMAG